ncbi:hypothetical protein J4471_05910 [Candidatus Woesearchaeota archaeon]|nr:hypothetical protein [Candidatus Woesearchaeota archaeon]
MEIKKEVGGIREEITKYLFWFVIFLIAFTIFFNELEKQCTTEECFNKMMKDCKKSNYRFDDNGHTFLYTINGNVEKDYCTVQIKLESLNINSEPSLKDKFAGKEMTCNIPYDVLDYVNILEEQRLLSYCSGPLKEAMLELMIEKLYGSIAQNFGTILNELEK